MITQKLKIERKKQRTWSLNMLDYKTLFASFTTSGESDEHVPTMVKQ